MFDQVLHSSIFSLAERRNWTTAIVVAVCNFLFRNMSIIQIGPLSLSRWCDRTFWIGFWYRLIGKFRKMWIDLSQQCPYFLQMAFCKFAFSSTVKIRRIGWKNANWCERQSLIQQSMKSNGIPSDETKGFQI